MLKTRGRLQVAAQPHSQRKHFISTSKWRDAHYSYKPGICGLIGSLDKQASRLLDPNKANSASERSIRKVHIPRAHPLYIPPVDIWSKPLHARSPRSTCLVLFGVCQCHTMAIISPSGNDVSCSGF
ncbi:hypothetical protein VTO42DRAFT_166 [Malbranchea cinnamomea]